MSDFDDFSFDPTVVPDRPSNDVLPIDNYIAQITESDFKPTKKGTGRYISLTLTIIDGQYAGRKLFDNLNIVNENKQAMDIANSTLKELMAAVGVAGTMGKARLIEMHNIPLTLKVGQTPRKDLPADASGNKPMQNTIRYKPHGNKVAPAGQSNAAPAPNNPAPSAPPSAVPSAPKKKPWEK